MGTWSRWRDRFRRSEASGDPGDEVLATPVGTERANPIEYLVRADDGSTAALLDAAIAELVPSSLPTRVVEDRPVLTVVSGAWSVEYSAEDPGWQLTFDSAASQSDAHRYAAMVADRLSQHTGAEVSAVQINGFDEPGTQRS